jgi:hypothetical protein
MRGAREAAMITRGWVRIACLLCLMSGCATIPPPGTGGTVSGALKSIELYPMHSTGETAYHTVGRDRFFASDVGLDVVLVWELPAPGDHAIKVALRTPAGGTHAERQLQSSATKTEWVTGHRFALPRAEEAKALAGSWAVEVALDGKPLGRRAFVFDPASARLQTRARMRIVQATGDVEVAAGDWVWTQQAAVLDHLRAAHTVLGIALRDELARRFPYVDGPQPAAADAEATILVRTKLGVSPNPSIDSRVTIEVVHVPTRATRTFQFRSSAGFDQVSGGRYFAVAAADLAFQAAASPDFIQHLISITQAAPE